MMGLLNILYTILKTKLSTDEYKLNIVLTDKYGVVIHQEVKVFQKYNLAQIDSLINELRKIGGDKI